ncbi:MAG: zinc-binding dehydrogenase, partial [Anaerolineae bacterium]
ERYSADVAVNASTGDFPAAVRRAAPDGADVVTDTTGLAKMFGSCLELVRREGKIILQGYYPEPIVIDFHPTHAKRVAVFFPCAWDDSADIARALSEGRLAIKPLITHRFSYRQAAEAYRLVLEEPDDVIAMVLKWE